MAYRDEYGYHYAECVTTEQEIDLEGLALSVNLKWEYTYHLEIEADPGDHCEVNPISVTVADVYSRDGESLDLPDQVLECIADKIWTIYHKDFIFCELINNSLLRHGYRCQGRPIPCRLHPIEMILRPLSETYIPKPRNRREAMQDDPDWFMEEARDRKDEEAADRRKGVEA